MSAAFKWLPRRREFGFLRLIRAWSAVATMAVIGLAVPVLAQAGSGDLVCSATLNHAIANGIDGTSVNWITGDIQDADVANYHFNPYNNSVQLTFWWNTGAPDNAGVSSGATSSDFLVLQAGDVVGAASIWSATNNPGPAAWAAGADGYLGFRFNCSSLPGAPASGICYGYAHLQTTAPAGFPATLVDYCYDEVGDDVTIGAVGAGDPIIGVTPASLSAAQLAGQTSTQTLSIANSGASNLSWSLAEEVAVAPGAPAGVAARQSAHVTTPHAPFIRNWALAPMAEVIQDGGFEQGNPNPYWDVDSQNFGTPICDASCASNPVNAPRSGSWWTWFGGVNGAETGHVRQDVTIASGTATLDFWVRVPFASGLAADYLAVSIDGTELWRLTADAATAYQAAYQQVTLDVSSFADGGVHTVSFDSALVGGGVEVTNFMLDDVSLDDGSTAVCSAPADVPWLALTPVSGTTAATDSSDVTVSFDSTGLVPGTYTANICVTSNDPATPLVVVPVSLLVNPTVTHVVTPSVGTGSGSITPATPQTIDAGDTAVFTLVPASGYVIGAVGGSCGGSLTGASYETNPISADCTVVANFVNTQAIAVPLLDWRGLLALAALMGLLGFLAMRAPRRR